jgi:GyrI-like small molecule binding domain
VLEPIAVDPLTGCAASVRPMGRVTALDIPAVELAVIEHAGPPAEVDRAYGVLAAYVAQHALAVDGAIREYYLVGLGDTPDSARWRTEIGWPVFEISSGAFSGYVRVLIRARANLDSCESRGGNTRLAQARRGLP